MPRAKFSNRSLSITLAIVAILLASYIAYFQYGIGAHTHVQLVIVRTESDEFFRISGNPYEQLLYWEYHNNGNLVSGQIPRKLPSRLGTLSFLTVNHDSMLTFGASPLLVASTNGKSTVLRLKHSDSTEQLALELFGPNGIIREAESELLRASGGASFVYQLLSYVREDLRDGSRL